MNTLKRIVGYYLVVQAGLGVLAGIGTPEQLVIIWAVSALCGYGGYRLIKSARNAEARRAKKEEQE